MEVAATLLPKVAVSWSGTPLHYAPFRDIVTHPSEPLPAPTAQRVSVGPPPRCKADLIDAVGRSEIHVVDPVALQQWTPSQN